MKRKCRVSSLSKMVLLIARYLTVGDILET